MHYTCMYAKDIKVINTNLTSETSKSTGVKRDYSKKRQSTDSSQSFLDELGINASQFARRI